MKSSSFKLGSSPQRRNRAYWVIGLITVLVLAAGIWFFVLKSDNSQVNRDDSAQTETAKDKLASKDSNPNTNDSNLPDDSMGITSDDVPTSEDITLSIIETAQGNGNVSATASIQGSEANGTCVFTYSSDDKPVVKQVTSSGNQCRVSIPEVEFARLGEWNLGIVFYSGNQKAEVSQSVTIR